MNLAKDKLDHEVQQLTSKCRELESRSREAEERAAQSEQVLAQEKSRCSEAVESFDCGKKQGGWFGRAAVAYFSFHNVSVVKSRF